MNQGDWLYTENYILNSMRLICVKEDEVLVKKREFVSDRIAYLIIMAYPDEVTISFCWGVGGTVTQVSYPLQPELGFIGMTMNLH